MVKSKKQSKKQKAEKKEKKVKKSKRSTSSERSPKIAKTVPPEAKFTSILPPPKKSQDTAQPYQPTSPSTATDSSQMIRQDSTVTGKKHGRTEEITCTQDPSKKAKAASTEEIPCKQDPSGNAPGWDMESLNPTLFVTDRPTAKEVLMRNIKPRDSGKPDPQPSNVPIPDPKVQSSQGMDLEALDDDERSMDSDKQGWGTWGMDTEPVQEEISDKSDPPGGLTAEMFRKDNAKNIAKIAERDERNLSPWFASEDHRKPDDQTWIRSYINGWSEDSRGAMREHLRSWYRSASIVKKADFIKIPNYEGSGSLIDRSIYFFGNIENVRDWIKTEVHRLNPFVFIEDQELPDERLLRQKFISDNLNNRPHVCAITAGIQAEDPWAPVYPEKAQAGPTMGGFRPVYVSSKLMELVIAAATPSLYQILFGNLKDKFNSMLYAETKRIRGDNDYGLTLVSTWAYGARLKQGFPDGMDSGVYPMVTSRAVQFEMAQHFIKIGFDKIMEKYGDYPKENEESEFVYVNFCTHYDHWVSLFCPFVLEHALYDIFNPEGLYLRDANFTKPLKNKQYQIRFEHMVAIRWNTLECAQRRVAEVSYCGMMKALRVCGVFDTQHNHGTHSARHYAWMTLMSSVSDIVLAEFTMYDFRGLDVMKGHLLREKMILNVKDLELMRSKGNLNVAMKSLGKFLAGCVSDPGRSLELGWRPGVGDKHSKKNVPVNCQLHNARDIKDKVRRRAVILDLVLREAERLLHVADAYGHIPELQMPVGRHQSAPVNLEPEELNQQNLGVLREWVTTKDKPVGNTQILSMEENMIDLLEEQMHTPDIDFNKVLQTMTKDMEATLKEVGYEPTYASSECSASILDSQAGGHGAAGISGSVFGEMFLDNMSVLEEELNMVDLKKVELEKRSGKVGDTRKRDPIRRWRYLGKLRRDRMLTSEHAKNYTQKAFNSLRSLQKNEWKTDLHVWDDAFTEYIHATIRGIMVQMGNFQKVVLFWEKTEKGMHAQDFVVNVLDDDGNPVREKSGSLKMVYERRWQLMAGKNCELVDIRIVNEVPWQNTTVEACCEKKHLAALHDLFDILMINEHSEAQFKALQENYRKTNRPAPDFPTFHVKMSDVWPHVFWRTVTNKEREAQRMMRRHNPLLPIREYTLGPDMLTTAILKDFEKTISKCRAQKAPQKAEHEIEVINKDGNRRTHVASGMKDTMGQSNDQLLIGDQLPNDFKQYSEDLNAPQGRPKMRPPPVPVFMTRESLMKLEKVTEEIPCKQDPSDFEPPLVEIPGTPDPTKAAEILEKYPILRVDDNEVRNMALKVQRLLSTEQSKLSPDDAHIKERLTLKQLELHFYKELNNQKLSCQCNYPGCVCKYPIGWHDFARGLNLELQCEGCFYRHPHHSTPGEQERDERLLLELHKAVLRPKVILMNEHATKQYKVLGHGPAAELSTEIREYEYLINSLYFQHHVGHPPLLPATLLNVNHSNWIFDLRDQSTVQAIQTYVTTSISTTNDHEYFLKLQCSLGLLYELSQIDNAKELLYTRLDDLEGKSYPIRRSHGQTKSKQMNAVTSLLHDVAVAYWNAFYHVKSTTKTTSGAFSKSTEAELLKVYTGNYVAKAIANGKQLTIQEWELIRVATQNSQFGGWHFIDELLGTIIVPSAEVLEIRDFCLSDQEDDDTKSFLSSSSLSGGTVSSYIELTSHLTDWTENDEWNIVYSRNKTDYDHVLATDTTMRLFQQFAVVQ